MKVILKPVSHPDMGNIDIVDDLFAIGRHEEPFASKLGEEASCLSRRHARVFREGDEIFLADLGSRNGTRVNKRELQRNVPTALRNNDRIVFADAVEFRVEIQPGTGTCVEKPPAIRLELVPEDQGSCLETIAIDSFPFLVSRNEGEFARYRDILPGPWRGLSRRHAVIAVKGGRVHVEDLGSRNGTFVGGTQLDERARPLQDGDVIAFGDPEFCYRVHIDQHERTQLAPSESSGTRIGRSVQAPSSVVPQPEVVPLPGTVVEPVVKPVALSGQVEDPEPSAGGKHRTRFVSSADSFINVFCASDPLKDEGGCARTAEVQQLKAPTTKLAKLRSGIRELWSALGGSSINRRYWWGMAAMVGGLVAVVVVLYMAGLERREIKQLLDQRQYAQGAAAANSYLEGNDDDAEAAAWGEDAMTRAIVPVWLEHMELGRFADARQYLETQRAAHPFIPRGLQMIDTLAWVGKVEAHLATRGGASGPIVLFRDEEPIRNLVAEWTNNRFRRQQIMDQIAARVPGFEPIHTRIFSSLTALRSDNALYVKAIDELKSNLQSALEQDERTAIDRLINEFASNYPRVTGVDALREDLARYDSLQQLVRQKELLQVVHLNRTAQFRTPIFANHVTAWLAKALPPPEVVATYAEASNAWQTGDHDRAIATLESVKNAPWGEVAMRQIERYRQVGADYDELQAAKGGDEYYDRLLVVWSALRPEEDGHLIKTLEPDFHAHREQMLPRLEKSLARVRGYWNEYQSAGGISGVTRVEGRVTPRFTSQAKRLSNAYREISSGARTYQLLQVTPSPEWQTLQREIVDEVQRQRRWLQDLNLVLEPVLLHAKLDLLPDVSEQSLWVQSTTDRKRD